MKNILRNLSFVSLALIIAVSSSCRGPGETGEKKDTDTVVFSKPSKPAPKPVQQPNTQRRNNRTEQDGLIEKGGVLYYKAQEGDTFASIAERFLGDRDKWINVFALNEAYIDDPDKIPVGKMLRMPRQ
ncbi:MAG: LysM peptidoglycan-binding domain-containing protein [Ignavibacteriales bacterium]|nr:LysM peptidoglycan-binding domain-containing protein [Ignavibacteriales bacterium]MCF8316800.1 LysM peptidoglycan-binding domain-containing protein [Ignavibacteriales bacterium]MCF8438376.1 LysM peptidoglycan-binding domain-containing protein [Ignavibacteriales bacterium]